MANTNTGKELLYKILNKERVSRPGWVPYAGIHAGSFKNYNSVEILRNEKKLIESLLLVYKLYAPDGLPIFFDLQLEAEILGCILSWESKTAPIVKSHPFEFAKKAFPKLPEADQGRLPVVISAMKELKKQIGDTTAIYGLVTGPLTLAFQLRGMGLFIDFFDDTEYIKKLLEYCTEVCMKVSTYYIHEKADIIAIVDPLISQISPQLLSDYLLQGYKNIFCYLNDKRVFSSFFVCGNASENIENMIMSGPNCIAIDENINIDKIKNIAASNNIILSGNIPINKLMNSSINDNQKYVIDLIETIGHYNFIVAPGCDLPYDVPKENIIAISNIIHNFNKAKKANSG